MKIGVTTYDMRADEFVHLARAVDEAGFDSLWTGEHVLLPVDYDTPHPTIEAAVKHTGPVISPDTNLVDPLVQLGAAAAVTSRVRLGTSIFVLPLRHPLAVARSVCTLQEVAGGRFTLGVGYGWLDAEFDALAIPFRERVGRFEEGVEIVRTALRGGPLTFSGKYFEFGSVQITKQATDVPMIFAGNTERALDRAVRLGDGWLVSGTPSFGETLRLKGEIERRLSDLPEQRPFDVMFRMSGCAADDARRYEDAGVEILMIWADQIWPAGRSLDDKRASVFAAAEALGQR
jgi:probable F420-dependent oxidoreductase